VGDSDDFFECRHSKWKVYQYKGGFRPTLEDNRLMRSPSIVPSALTRRYNAPHEDWRIVDSIQRGVMEAFLPSTAVVDENLNLIYVSGVMDMYLRVPSGGLFTANILKQAREGLAVPLSTAIHKVFKDHEEVIYKNISFGDGGLVDLKAKPFTEPATRQKMALIQLSPVVQEESAKETVHSFDINSSTHQRIQDLEHELQYTRESLQATVEELETSNEELQATNEELFASNEELQSTNEELHSVNEELITVNAEYHAKIQELSKLNEDVNNLLSSTDVGTIFLDRDLRIRLFTPMAQHEIHLLDQDVGRPIGHVTNDLLNCDLIYESQQVLKTLVNREMEVQNKRGRWYQLRFLPYYTLQQQVGGVVITLMDITAFKMANIQLKRLSVAVEQSPVSIVITDPKGTIEYVNPRFTEITGYSLEEAIGNNPRLLKSEKTPPETYRQLWATIVAGKEWHGEFINRKKNGEVFYESASVSPIKDEKGVITHFLAVKEDVTFNKQAEEALRQSEQLYRLLVASLPDTSVLLFDRSHRYLIAGGEELGKAGFDRAKVEGFALAEAFPPEVQKQFAPLYDAALAGRPSYFEHSYGDGTYYQRVIPVRNEQGEIYAGMVVTHNITDRVRMEDALRLNLEKYRVLFDVFPLGITVADRNGKILESNHEAEILLGISKAEHQNRAIDDAEWKIIRPDGSPMPTEEYASVRALQENRVVENVEMGIIRPDGETTWIKATAAPLGDYGVVVTYTRSTR
jgi:PAS domain S-box-containing protein